MPSPDLSVKLCRKCGVEHPLGDFYGDARASDGLDSSCKASRHARRAERRKADPMTVRAQGRKDLAAWRARNPGLPSRRSNRPADPQKHRARSALSMAIRRGSIARPEQCESCGARGRIHGHHHRGYDREHYYDVEWVCPACHGERHRLAVA